MNWETLPNWVWVIYYLFFITLGASVYSLFKSINSSLTVISIILVISTPLIAMINSIGRKIGYNEMEHWFSNLQHGSIWALYVLIGSFYIIFWWLMFSKSYFKEQRNLFN
ncbi:hypothetical protein [Bacillus sp. Cs-700]|uniref:hypothetical protein n=1 Tax=Bacillus sp. Cs-700 TaxID=2589818 RepID=UPI00140C1C18|nr:hypothetical protein [Bacillus sp. Cs-700]